jgi:hypothetical protein
VIRPQLVYFGRVYFCKNSAVVVDDRLRIATLEHRLARIGGLARC